MSVEEMDFIPTKGSAAKRKNNFESVVHNSYKPKKNDDKVKTTTKLSPSDDKSFDIKKIKHEVMKFGMSGFDRSVKEEAKIQQAIKLGAKPPRNKYKNYKQLMEERKKQKDREKSVTEFQQLGKNKIGKSIAKGKKFYKNRKYKKGGLLDVYGKVKKLD